MTLRFRLRAIPAKCRVNRKVLDVQPLEENFVRVKVLCAVTCVMLFASTTSEDDVKLFKFHLKELNARRAEESDTA